MANNAYFAQLYGVSPRSVRLWIAELQQAKFIVVDDHPTHRMIRLSARLEAPLFDRPNIEGGKKFPPPAPSNGNESRPESTGCEEGRKKISGGKKFPGGISIISYSDNTNTKTGKAKRRTVLTNVQLARFEVFWSKYPNRVARGAAEKAWKRIDPDEALLHTMTTAIERQTEEKEQRLRKNLFTPEWPHASTWLNQLRWEDEVRLLHPAGQASTLPTLEEAIRR